MRVLELRFPKRSVSLTSAGHRFSFPDRDTPTRWWHTITNHEPGYPWVLHALEIRAPTYFRWWERYILRSDTNILRIPTYFVPDGKYLVINQGLPASSPVVLCGRPLALVWGTYELPETMPAGVDFG